MSSNHDINGAALAELDADTSGPVLTAGEDGYDDARRVWNGRFDRRPAVISRCRNRDDIGAAVDFARSQGLPLAVKGGGHDYGGNPARDDSVLIDCSAMDSVTVDPEAQVARVGPGVTWAEFDEQAQAHGLATTGATVSSVGVAGYTLGGGTGHLARTHGLAADNLRAAEVVTANGEAVRASEDRHPELFWALRGGSGNFGVVTEFEFDLHPVGPEILAGQVIHPYEDAPEVLRHYRSFMAEAPAELNCYAFVIPIPPLPAFPEEIHGDPAVDLVAAYSGDIEAGEDALAPLREFGNPILDGIRRQPYTELQQAFDDGAPKGERW
jgi:FAD/FMN-containing dehydrogenase